MSTSPTSSSPRLTAEERSEILDLIARYGVHLDRREFDRLDQVFTDDVVFEYPVGSLQGLGEFQAFLDKGLQGWAATQHMMTTTLIEGGVEDATGFVHVTAHHAVGSLPAPPQQVYTITGTYRDRYVRTEAGWRISHRQFTPTTTVGDRAALGKTY
jgi:ketosteroid isomerase-like protein